MRKEQMYRLGCLAIFLLIVIFGACNVDDAYHGFVMARNLADGNGFVYNVGERVNASTCPLFDLILGCFYFFTRNMVATAFVLCTTFSVAAYAIIIWKMCTKTWQVLFVTAVLGTSHCFMAFTTSGLENSLLFLEETIFLLIVLKHTTFNFKQLLYIALICSSVLVTRMDAGILLFCVTAYCFLIKRDCSIFKMLFAGAVGLCPFFIWEGFSFIYYGTFFPNTYYIKLNSDYPVNEYIMRGVKYIFVTWGYDVSLITFIVVGILILFFYNDVKLKLLGLGICLKVIYLIRIGGDFMVGRHFTDLFLVSIIIIAWTGNFRENIKMKKKSFSYEKVCIIFGIICVMFTTVSRELAMQYMWPKQNFCADETEAYYPTLGMMPILINKIQKNMDTSDVTWDSSEVMNSKAKGYKGDMLNWAPGVLTYKNNEDFYMSDSVGLGDPLLSKLPAIYEEGWRVGHMRRFVPEGYKESLVTNMNLITDESLHKYYDYLLEITRGKIFSQDRLKKTIAMFGGKYDYLLDEYAENLEKKSEYTFRPYSKDFAYEGEMIQDLVRITGNGESKLNGTIYNLESGTYTLSMSYDYRIKSKIENTKLIISKNGVVVQENQLSENDEYSMVGGGVHVVDTDNISINLIVASGEVLDIGEIKILKE